MVVLSASEDSELPYVTMFACESVVLCARSFGTRVHGTKTIGIILCLTVITDKLNYYTIVGKTGDILFYQTVNG